MQDETPLSTLELWKLAVERANQAENQLLEAVRRAADGGALPPERDWNHVRALRAEAYALFRLTLDDFGSLKIRTVGGQTSEQANFPPQEDGNSGAKA